MANSLYGGGHEGVSFVLKASFPSVADAVSACSKGSTYTDVWYGEYLIIDTPNKNDRDNGKIFKRGLDYLNGKGGLQQIGQVVGPSSGTPYFSLDTIESAQAHGTETLDDYSYRRFPTGRNADGSYTTSEGSGTPAVFDFSHTPEGGLVPGKDGDSYNDTIKYTWVNIRKDDADADSWFYVGIQVPYTVIDYKIHDVSPYDANGNRLTDPTTISRTDTKDHPFWEEWDLGLAHGIKGDALRNLRVIVPTTADVIYDPANITVDRVSGRTRLGTPGYTGQQDDITNRRQILVYSYYMYDDVVNPTPVLVYLGDFNIISNVALDDDGTLRIDYTHNSQSHFDRKVRWITGVTLTTGNGSQGGRFTVSYNNGTPSYVTNLTWIKDIQVDKDTGDVTYTYSGTDGGRIPANGIVTVPHMVRWVTDASLNTENGHFELDFNDDTNYSTTLDWVKDLSINEDGKGTIVLHHTTGDVTSQAKLKTVERATLANNGVITLYFNTGETATITNVTGTDDFHLQMVTDISLATDVRADKHIRVRYNTSDSDEPIGDPINYIQDVVVRSNDFHLLVLFSDPSHRPSVAGDGSVTYPSGTTASSWVTNTSVRATFGNDRIPDYGSDVYWRDFGAIKDDHGVLVGMDVPHSVIASAGYDDIVQYLNNKYPQGLNEQSTNAGGEVMGKAVAQKVVTYTPNESGGKQDREFYAFDYNANSWYYLGTIADNGSRDVKLLDSNDVTASNYSSLNSKGLLFVRSSDTVSGDPIPRYWAPDFAGSRA